MHAKLKFQTESCCRIRVHGSRRRTCVADYKFGSHGDDSGKKSVAEGIVYGAFDLVAERRAMIQ